MTQFSVSQVELILSALEVPGTLASRLRNGSVDIDLTGEEALELNNLCIRAMQEHGFAEDGKPNGLGRELERIVDKLNAE